MSTELQTVPSNSPEPGTQQARQAGCTCPVQSHAGDVTHAYLVDRGCPLHYLKHSTDDEPERHGWRERLPDWMPGSMRSNLVPRRAAEDEDDYFAGYTSTPGIAVDSLNTMPIYPPPYLYHNDPYPVASVVPAVPTADSGNPRGADTSATGVIDQPANHSGFGLPEFHLPEFHLPDVGSEIQNAASSVSEAVSHTFEPSTPPAETTAPSTYDAPSSAPSYDSGSSASYDSGASSSYDSGSSPSVDTSSSTS